MASFDKITFKVGVEKPSRSWHTGAQEVTVEPFAWIDMNIPTSKYPTHSVTWEEVKSLCESVGKRQLSVRSWLVEKEGRMYSYGQHRNRNTCNTPIGRTGPKDGMFPTPDLVKRKIAKLPKAFTTLTAH